MRIDPRTIEDAAKELYIRALKILPDDVKRGFDTLAARETSATAKDVLGTMIANIAVAERTDNLLCQDTGIPIYNVTVGRGVDLKAEDGIAQPFGARHLVTAPPKLVIVADAFLNKFVANHFVCCATGPVPSAPLMMRSSSAPEFEL